MKKNVIVITLVTAVIMVMSSCGGKTQAVPFDDGDTIDVAAAQDPTIYGVCGEGTAMNTLQIVTDLGEIGRAHV